MKSFKSIAKKMPRIYTHKGEKWCKFMDVLDMVASLSNAHSREVTQAILKAVKPYSMERDRRDDRTLRAMQIVAKVHAELERACKLVDTPTGTVKARLNYRIMARSTTNDL